MSSSKKSRIKRKADPISVPSLSELLAVIAEVEGLEATLARFPGLSRDDLVAVLLGTRQLGLFEKRLQAPDSRLQAPERAAPSPSLKLWTDGASRGNPGPASVGVVIQNAKGELVDELSERLGVRTNNYAEYEAVRRGLRRALELNANKVTVHADSELVVRQLNGVYRVKNPDLLPIYTAIKAVEREFARGVTYKHVRREQNADADRLANLALDSA